jgi:hypothetical protein
MDRKLTIVQLPVDSRYPRMRSCELWEGDTLAVIGRSVGPNGTEGTYEAAAEAARAESAKMRAIAGAICAVLGDAPAPSMQLDAHRAVALPATAAEDSRVGLRVYFEGQGEAGTVVADRGGLQVRVDWGERQGWEFWSDLVPAGYVEGSDL